MLAHHFRRPLSYIGFGGSGRQVRDLLHVEDLVDLVEVQVSDPAVWNGQTLNVGGGRESSLSLRETSAICAEITGVDLDIQATSEERPGDIPVYVSDCAKLFSLTDWRPRRAPRETLADIHAWICRHEDAISDAL
jgi:CDP-paratose 2-epimerase